MEITQITISYGRTQSLSNYCNVKPHASVTVTYQPGDDLRHIYAAALADLQSLIHETIDQALEGDGSAAHFSTEPRYSVAITSGVWSGEHVRTRIQPPEHMAIILPEHNPLVEGTGASPWLYYTYHGPRNMRLPQAITAAAAAAAAAEYPTRVIDCSSGDYSTLPAWLFQPPAAPPSTEHHPAIEPDPATHAQWPDDE